MSDLLLEGHLHRRCGGRYGRATEQVTVRVSGMSASVERHLYRCDKCGDERRTVEQRERAEQEAIATMRSEHQLLLPREIRQLRERLGLTAQQLGELLYGIPRGIVEGWERGRYVQNPEVDALLRSLEERETLERRAVRAGVSLPVPASEAGAGAEPDSEEVREAQQPGVQGPGVQGPGVQGPGVHESAVRTTHEEAGAAVETVQDADDVVKEVSDAAGMAGDALRPGDAKAAAERSDDRTDGSEQEQRGIH